MIKFLRFTCDQIKYASGILPKCDVRSKRKFRKNNTHAQQKIHSFSTAVFYNPRRAQTGSLSREMTFFELKRLTAAAGISTGQLSTRGVIFVSLASASGPSTAMDGKRTP